MSIECNLINISIRFKKTLTPYIYTTFGCAQEARRGLAVGVLHQAKTSLVLRSTDEPLATNRAPNRVHHGAAAGDDAVAAADVSKMATE